ncbi:MAG: hypothetical protein JWN61_1913 [Pseudonocardiales bacterium]|nr:hypothetical protein [Jatrophihabitantaceae bacterium]MCW2603778.1 hypothetical protein [Pseudonocardiales bacterium]
MWAFLSTRLRTWVLFAVAIPVIRYLVHRFSEAAQRKRPGSRSASLLSKADSTLASFASRRERKRARKTRS